jgi:chromosome segregation ATPase
MRSLAACQVESARRFALDLSESQLQLLNSDIDAANKQLLILRSECELLSQTLKDLEFNLDELTVEQRELSAQEPAPVAGQRQFFDYLSSLETRESDDSARLESHRRLQTDLLHQLNRLKQENCASVRAGCRRGGADECEGPGRAAERARARE